MATAQAQALIAADPERVWSLITDVPRYGEWVAGHEGFVGQPPSALSSGATFGQTMRVMGMPATVNWAVTQMQEPTHAELEGEGPMGITIKAAYDVVAADGGSDVTVRYSFSGGAVFAVAGQLEREVGATLTQSLDNLAKLV